MSAEARLEELGITLPPPPPLGGVYKPLVELKNCSPKVLPGLKKKF